MTTVALACLGVERAGASVAVHRWVAGRKGGEEGGQKGVPEAQSASCVLGLITSLPSWASSHACPGAVRECERRPRCHSATHRAAPQPATHPRRSLVTGGASCSTSWVAPAEVPARLRARHGVHMVRRRAAHERAVSATCQHTHVTPPPSWSPHAAPAVSYVCALRAICFCGTGCDVASCLYRIY